jgi:hypothetical protein
MHEDLLNEWVRCREGKYGRVSTIDKAGYCTLVDAEGKTVKGHEPAHTLAADFRAYVAGGAAEAKLRQNNSK